MPTKGYDVSEGGNPEWGQEQFHPGPGFNIQKPRLVIDKRGLVGITWKYVEGPDRAPNGRDLVVHPIEVHDVTPDFIKIIQHMETAVQRSMLGSHR